MKVAESVLSKVAAWSKRNGDHASLGQSQRIGVILFKACGRG